MYNITPKDQQSMLNEYRRCRTISTYLKRNEKLNEKIIAIGFLNQNILV